MDARRTAPLALAAFLALAAAGTAQAGPEEDITKAGCVACHTKDKKLVGPSFKEIAAKHKAQPNAAALAEKVRKGGQGVYGPIPMPPNGPDKIGDAELKGAVEWILKQ